MLSPQKLSLLLVTYVGVTNAWFGTIAYSDNTEDQVWGTTYDECRALPQKQPITIYIGENTSAQSRIQIYSDRACYSYIRSLPIETLNEIAPGETVGSFKVVIPCSLTSGPCTAS